MVTSIGLYVRINFEVSTKSNGLEEESCFAVTLGMTECPL